MTARIRAASVTRRIHPAEIGLAVLAAIAVAIFIAAGITRPIWQDDANAVLMARQNFGGMLTALRSDNNLPFYYVLLFGWLRLFGESEAALRMLSVVFYLGGGAAVYGLGQALYRSRRVGLYSALLYLGSTQLVGQAQSVRMYTMLGCLAAVSLLLFFRILVEGRNSRGAAVAYVLINSAGVLTQVWFFFLLFGQFLYQVTGLRRGTRKFLALTGASGVVFALVWGQTLLGQLHNGSTHWLPPFRPGYLIDIWVEFYGGGAAGLLFLLCFVLPIVLALRQRREAVGMLRPAMLLTVLGACTLVPLAVSIVKPVYFSARYSTVGLPALAVLLGAILALVAPRSYALAVCSGLLIVSAAFHMRDRNQLPGRDVPPGQSDRTTAEFLVQHAVPGDYIVFTNLVRPAADYYFRRLGAEGRFTEITFPEELDRHPGWLDREAMASRPDALATEAARTTERLREAVLSGKRVWMYNGLPGVSDFLKVDLDRSLVLAGREELSGPFHRELLRYEARPAAETSRLEVPAVR